MGDRVYNWRQRIHTGKIRQVGIWESPQGSLVRLYVQVPRDRPWLLLQALCTHDFIS